MDGWSIVIMVMVTIVLAQSGLRFRDPRICSDYFRGGDLSLGGYVGSSSSYARKRSTCKHEKKKGKAVHALQPQKKTKEWSTEAVDI